MSTLLRSPIWSLQTADVYDSRGGEGERYGYFYALLLYDDLISFEYWSLIDGCLSLEGEEKMAVQGCQQPRSQGSLLPVPTERPWLGSFRTGQYTEWDPPSPSGGENSMVI